MGKQKYDGVVEAVHYNPNGQVDWVRAFKRQGFVFTDRVMIKRVDFIEQLKAGKNYVVGKRVPYMANTFEVSENVRVIDRGGSEILVTGDTQADKDRLEGIPLI